jgi:hypothetical protein
MAKKHTGFKTKVLIVAIALVVGLLVVSLVSVAKRPTLRLPGTETARIQFNHPSWGKVTLLISKEGPNKPGHIIVFDSAGYIRWDYTMMRVYELGAYQAPRDRSGNLFLYYNPGRYNGVIVLRPDIDGMESFGTLPPPGDYESRFYSADIADDNGDGTYEINVDANACLPDCATGTITRTTYRWNGRDYVGSVVGPVRPNGHRHP